MKGIARDRHGWRVYAKVGSGPAAVQAHRRFPPDTPEADLKAARARLEAELRDRVPAVARGSLANDAQRYLGQIQHLASWKERRCEVRAWVDLYGALPRARLTGEHVRKAMAIWLADGYAVKTVLHRVHTLRNLSRTLDGRYARTPCDDVTLPKAPRLPPVIIAPALIRTVLARLWKQERHGLLRDGKTRARFMVRAATGRRPCEIMRAEPHDVDLARRVWMPRDAKGGHSPGIYLNDDMRAAWEVFVAEDAWGAFNTHSFARVLRHAGWPDGVRPYNLRHSVGMALSESGTDLADVGAHLGHTRTDTTRRFYVPILHSRLQAASERLAGRLGFAGLSAAAATRRKAR